MNFGKTVAVVLGVVGAGFILHTANLEACGGLLLIMLAIKMES
jgi:hypothetical protein